MIRFRPATEQDIPAICALPRTPQELFHLFPKADWPLDHDQLAPLLRSRECCTVAVLPGGGGPSESGRVVGFANFFRWCYEGACAIGNVVVDPSLRRQGVGSALITHMVDLGVRRFRMTHVRIFCFDDNPGAMAMYKGLGFETVSSEKREGLNGESVTLVGLEMAVPGAQPAMSPARRGLRRLRGLLARAAPLSGAGRERDRSGT